MLVLTSGTAPTTNLITRRDPSILVWPGQGRLELMVINIAGKTKVKDLF